MVLNPGKYSVRLTIYLAVPHPGCQHTPSLLLAREGWNTVVGPGLQQLSPIILSPTLTTLVVLLVTVERTRATWTAFIMVRVCCTSTALRWSSTKPVTSAASAPFSPSTSKSTVSPSLTLPRDFLGLFFMTVCSTNTSSFVPFLLMKPFPFLKLNYFTVPKTSVLTTFLSPLEGATDVRLSRLPPCVGCTEKQGRLLQLLREVLVARWLQRGLPRALSGQLFMPAPD